MRMGNPVRDAASLSAMLESSDHGSSSLDSVMTSSNSPCTGPPGDSHHLFASQYSSPLLGSSFPVSAASSGQQLAIPTSSSGQMPEWPYSRDERWVFEPSEGTSSTRATNLRSNIGVLESSLNPPGYGRGSLQRGNSAPSILFEECLADFNSEEVVTPASSDPFRDRDDDLLTWADNLAPIVESGPQQMDTKIHAGDANSSLDGCSEQFLVSQTGFERRISTISTPTQSFGPGVVEPRSLSHQDGLGGFGATPAIPDNIGESRPTPSFTQMASFLSLAESMSGTSEMKYVGGNSTTSSAYPAPDHQPSYQLRNELLPEAASGSGLWNYPTTPGMLEVNSLLRGMGEMTNNEPPGWLGSTSAKSNVGGALEPAPLLPGLIRHSSLPANPRAIRGHATHPRSIAERVRRGKINERMKKLQDLVPNMERQNNTAVMLDEVVEYVKQLKLQVLELSNTVVQLKERSLHPD